MGGELYTVGETDTGIYFQSDWRVLDIADRKHPRADEHVKIEDAMQAISEWDDKVFGFVLLEGGLARIDDPAGLCAEMGRIGKQGFLEVRSAMNEWLFPDHRNQWLFGPDGETLLAVQKNGNFRPFSSSLVQMAQAAQWRTLFRFDIKAHRRLLYVRCIWRDELACRIGLNERDIEVYWVDWGRRIRAGTE